MSKKTKLILFLAFILIIFNGALPLSVADDHKEKKWYQKILGHDDENDNEKHHEVSPNVLKHEAIGSLSNCSACHTTAKDGIYEDDNVIIPK